MSETGTREQASHNQLRDGQLALQKALEEHKRDFSKHQENYRETTVRLFEKVDEAIGVSNDNKVALATMVAEMKGVTENRSAAVAMLQVHDASIRALQDMNNRREGERGVWAAIARNPVISWLVTAAVGTWAYIYTHAGAIKP